MERRGVLNSAHPKIHVWIPDYESAVGGIQVFSRFLVRALGDCLPSARLTVLSKNDNCFPLLPPRRPPSAFYCSGWWPIGIRTAAFTCQLMTRALKERPDLIVSTHVNFTPAAMSLKRLAGIPYAAVAHGVDVWGVRRRGLRRSLQRADRVLAVSRFTRGRMQRELELDSARVGVLPNAFEPETFVPSAKPRYLLKRFGLSADQPVILTVARLASADRYKGYDQILRALPAIRRVVPGVRYILAGRGPDRPRVEALVSELNLEETARLAGYVPNHELCDFYNLCDVFAMPSKGEGFGIVFLEALSCGKPVLAGNKDGSKDALLDGELGVLVDPDDVAQIADALTSMLTGRHPLSILRQPEGLRARVIEAFSYDRFVRYVAGHLARLGFQCEPAWIPAGSLVT
jgi:glycosyltransferase involved in cell wall biosynthesis